MTDTTPTSPEDRLVELEARMSWLEAANDELSQIVYRQQTLLDEAVRRLASLGERMREMGDGQSGGSVGSLEDEVPPHY